MTDTVASQQTILSSLIIALALHGSAQGFDGPVSVCDLIQNIKRYRGKGIEVRGELRAGPEESAIYGVDCPSSLTTSGHPWLNALWVLSPGDFGAGQVDFKLDEKAMQLARSAIDRERSAGRRGRVIITLIGKCEARTTYFGGRNSNGEWIGNGYGHLNGYPAQIVVQSVKDVQVLDK